MNDTFRIGETALIRTDIFLRVEPAMCRYLGEFVVVEGAPHVEPGEPTLVYLVRCLADHALLLASSRALKKLPPGPPPTDMLDSSEPLKVTRWSESPWRPREVKA